MARAQRGLIFRGDLPDGKVDRIVADAAADERLSHKARGILLSIAKHPGGEIDLQQFIGESADGPDTVLSGLSELVEKGYLKRERRATSVGRGRAPIDYHLVAETQVRVA